MNLKILNISTEGHGRVGGESPPLTLKRIDLLVMLEDASANDKSELTNAKILLFSFCINNCEYFSGPCFIVIYHLPLHLSFCFPSDFRMTYQFY